MILLLFYKEKEGILNKLRKIEDTDSKKYFLNTFKILYKNLFFDVNQEFIAKKDFSFMDKKGDSVFRIINIFTYFVPLIFLYLIYKYGGGINFKSIC